MIYLHVYSLIIKKSKIYFSDEFGWCRYPQIRNGFNNLDIGSVFFYIVIFHNPHRNCYVMSKVLGGALFVVCHLLFIFHRLSFCCCFLSVACRSSFVINLNVSGILSQKLVSTTLIQVRYFSTSYFVHRLTFEICFFVYSLLSSICLLLSIQIYQVSSAKNWSRQSNFCSVFFQIVFFIVCHYLLVICFLPFVFCCQSNRQSKHIWYPQPKKERLMLRHLVSNRTRIQRLIMVASQ